MRRCTTAALILLVIALYSLKAEAYKCRCTRKGPKIRYKDVQKLEIKPKHPFCQEKMILSKGKTYLVYVSPWRMCRASRVRSTVCTPNCRAPKTWSSGSESGRISIGCMKLKPWIMTTKGKQLKKTPQGCCRGDNT
uniref:Chemokine interleukin-8-like domain-containing protein n=1 Tax=Esox lucius TaxID=8010 RepID=A0AAY5K028_ESOLU